MIIITTLFRPPKSSTASRGLKRSYSYTLGITSFPRMSAGKHLLEVLGSCLHPVFLFGCGQSCQPKLGLRLFTSCYFRSLVIKCLTGCLSRDLLFSSSKFV